jgi:hypothetical protein
VDRAEDSQNTYLGRNASGMHMKPRGAPALITGGSRRACLTPTRRGWVGAEAFPQDLKGNGTETRQGQDFRSRSHWADSGEPGWSSGWCKTYTRTRSLPHCAHHCVTRAAVRRHDGRERSRHHASQANEPPRACHHARHARERTHAVADYGGDRQRADHAYGRHRAWGGQHVGDHLTTPDWPRPAHSCSVTSMPLLRN